MTFDPRFKETARAHDAVDRLRELQDRVRAEDARKAGLRDKAIRYSLVAVLAALVTFAFRSM